MIIAIFLTIGKSQLYPARKSRIAWMDGKDNQTKPRAAIVITPALIETRDHTWTMARTFNDLRSPFLKERRINYRKVSYIKTYK